MGEAGKKNSEDFHNLQRVGVVHAGEIWRGATISWCADLTEATNSLASLIVYSLVNDSVGNSGYKEVQQLDGCEEEVRKDRRQQVAAGEG